MSNFASATYTNVEKDAIRGAFQATPLSNLFFSDLNRNALQEGMRNLVYKQTKEVIGKQSDIELLQIMRSIYTKNANHYPPNLVEETKRLNTIVLEFAVNTIVNEIKMHKKYLYDINTIAQPIEFAQATSVRGQGEYAVVYKPFV